MAGNAPHIPGCRDLSLIGERVARSLFSAHSDSVGRPVTVTVFPPLSEGRTSDAFDEAAAVAQRLGAHPSVLTIHEWGHAKDGRPWIVTEPQPPESVDTLLTMDGPLDVERALQVGVLLAGALETAHRAGIVHGDLQPARLVFGDNGEPLLVETGLAAFAVFPGLGALNNPVRYFAPPEVLERTDTTTATDVYSLGATVYALLAGRAPQQKPAEITDSNASLLLRILQMSVPPIDRHDLPAGLEDALRSPLSPTPSRRPQRAIEVAWLLQDVQRRAGYAVTEPVVLDLDAAGGARLASEVPATTAAGGALLAPAGGQAQPDAAAALAQPERAAAAPPADPWAPTEGAGDPWGAVDPPADPPPDFPAEVVPPPTIFPFAEGLDDGAATGTAAGPVAPSPWADAPEPNTPEPAMPEAAPEPSPWTPAPDAAEQSLWPSSWPADQQPSELPSWAAAPTGPDGSDDPGTAPLGAGTAPMGDDGGSISDVASGRNGHGAGERGALRHGGLPTDLPSPGSSADHASDLPPELDELPAWYTDPLPNEGAGAPRDVEGSMRAPGEGDRTWSAAPVPDPQDLWPEAPGSDDGAWPTSADPGRRVDPETTTAGFARPTNGYDTGLHPGGDAAAAAGGWSDPVDERLPGSGDELRSLFGEVVRDPEPDPYGHPAPANGPPATTARVDSYTDTDPLGPPSDRPPIDLSRLDTPLGPAPYLPARGGDDHGGERAARLPRRHEVPALPSPAGRDGRGPRDGGVPARLPRADEAYPVRAQDDQPAARPDRSVPRQVAPDPNREPSPAGAASAGPPAMPVIVLVAVVAILLLGVAWLVITGDDAEAPASDRPAATDDADAGGGAGAAAGSSAEPTGLVATPVPEGIQISWTGDPGASYVVTMLSPDQAPQALPPITGTSQLVQNVELASGGGRCFTVAAAPDAQGVPGTASAPACTPDATIEGMQPAVPAG